METNTNMVKYQPLYSQIKFLILDALARGEWKPSELMPTEIDLAERFSVSSGTVRKAIDALVAEHVIIRKQGIGTFVASHQEHKTHYRFLRYHPDSSDYHNRIGKQEQYVSVYHSCDQHSQNLPLEFTATDAEFGQKVSYIHRSLCLSEVDLSNRQPSPKLMPMIFEEIWLLGDDLNEITLNDLNQHTGSLYTLLEQRFDTKILRAEERIKAVAASETVAERLEIKVNAPVLQIDRRSYTYKDKLVEIRRGSYKTEQHHYRNELD